MTTAIYPSQGLLDKIRGKSVFLDTNVFICCLKCDELTLFLANLRVVAKAELLTISSVIHEYTRSSKTLEEFNERREFVLGLVNSVNPIGKMLEDNANDIFSVVMSKLVSSRDSDYTDFLLATCLYRYTFVDNNYFLMTADQRSMPRNIFDIVGSITISDKDGSLHSIGVYQFNKSNFYAIAEKI